MPLSYVGGVFFAWSDEVYSLDHRPQRGWWELYQYDDKNPNLFCRSIHISFWMCKWCTWIQCRCNNLLPSPPFHSVNKSCDVWFIYRRVCKAVQLYMPDKIIVTDMKSKSTAVTSLCSWLMCVAVCLRIPGARHCSFYFESKNWECTIITGGLRPLFIRA